MNERNYITILGWMRSELELKGNELLIFAIIWGFSQTAEQKFSGSLKYLADWCGITKQSVITVLKSLVSKGLIERYEKILNGIQICEYRVVKKFEHGYSNNLNEGIQNFRPNNTNDITNINNTININNNKGSQKFLPPTLEEVQAYCKERNSSVDPKQFFEYFNAGNWIDSKGQHVRNWKQKLMTWEKYNASNNSGSHRLSVDEIKKQSETEEIPDWAKGVKMV